MGKKKDALAFYELISKGKAKGGPQMTVPAWMAGGEKSAAAPTVEPPPALPPRPLAPPPPAAPAPAVPAEPAKVRPAVSAVERPAVSAVERPVAPPRPPKPAKVIKAPSPRPPERIVVTEGKRLKLSITTTHAVAAGVVLLILIVGMFVLGRVARFSSSSSSSSPALPPAPVRPMAQDKSQRTAAAERREAPKPPPKAAERKEESTGKPLADNAAKLEKGKYYLVVQGLMGMDSHHRVEAEAIANFLNSNGEPVVVMTYKGTPQQYIVLSQRGFDSPDSPEAKKYMQAIEEQGKLYRSQGGKYDFNQGPSGWFVRM